MSTGGLVYGPYQVLCPFFTLSYYFRFSFANPPPAHTPARPLTPLLIWYRSCRSYITNSHLHVPNETYPVVWTNVSRGPSLRPASCSIPTPLLRSLVFTPFLFSVRLFSIFYSFLPLLVSLLVTSFVRSRCSSFLSFSLLYFRSFPLLGRSSILTPRTLTRQHRRVGKGRGKGVEKGGGAGYGVERGRGGIKNRTFNKILLQPDPPSPPIKNTDGDGPYVTARHHAKHVIRQSRPYLSPLCQPRSRC